MEQAQKILELYQQIEKHIRYLEGKIISEEEENDNWFARTNKKRNRINENHIENFPLETETGTKKMKEKFHQKAVKNEMLILKKS